MVVLRHCGLGVLPITGMGGRPLGLGVLPITGMGGRPLGLGVLPITGMGRCPFLFRVLPITSKRVRPGRCPLFFRVLPALVTGRLPFAFFVSQIVLLIPRPFLVDVTHTAFLVKSSTSTSTAV